MPSPKDFVIAKLALKERLLTQQQLQECYQAQAQQQLPLGDVLLQKGLIDRHRYDLLDRACDEAMKTGRVMSCPKCGIKYFVSQWASGQVYPCPKCAAPMTPMQDIFASVQGADENLISTVKVRVAAQRAEEARHEAVKLVQKARETGRLRMRPKARLDVHAVPHDSGKPFGDYSLREKLGAGGSAVVFKAMDTRTNATVALKIIKSLDATRGDVQEYVKRFDREAKRVRTLSHPNSAPVFDHGKYGDNLYLAMHFIEGTSLEQLIAAENSEETRTRFSTTWDRSENLVLLVRDALLALQHAHERGVVHQDVKPSNLFMDAGGRCYITDFGIGREVDKEVAEALAGKSERDLSYLSPEQAGYKGLPIDARSDIFSMGVVLYEILTLRRPFGGDKPKQVLDAILQEYPRDPRQWDRNIPSDLRWVCLKALEKHPGDRYQTAGEFADDLSRYVAGDPVLAARQTLGRQLVHLMGRDPRVKWTLVGCAVSLLVSAISAFVLPGILWGVRSHSQSAEAQLREETARTRRKAAEPFLLSAHASLAKAMKATEPSGVTAFLQDARDAAIRATATDPESDEGFVLLGQTLRLEASWDPALVALTRAILFQPRNPRGWLERGRVFLEIHRNYPTEKHYEKSGGLALRDLRQALALATRPVEQGMAQGLLNVLLANEAEALAGFKLAIDAQPDLAEAFSERGRLRLFRIQTAEALADFDLALRHYPGCVWAHIGRGQALLVEGKAKEASTAFDAAMNFGPAYPWAKSGAAAAAMAQDNSDLALELLNGLTSKAPRFADAFANRGTLHVRKGNVRGALADFDRALELNPEFWEALANRGYAYLVGGQREKARSDFVLFQAKVPNHPFRYQVDRWLRSLE